MVVKSAQAGASVGHQFDDPVRHMPSLCSANVLTISSLPFSGMSLSSSTDCGADRMTEMRLLLTTAEIQQKVALAVSMCATLVTPSTAGGDFSVNPLAPKVTRLANLVGAHGSVFKSATGLFLSEWERLCQRVVPALTLSARSTGSPKLSPADQISRTRRRGLCHSCCTASTIQECDMSQHRGTTRAPRYQAMLCLSPVC
jgi:hypothetical protein